MTENKIPPFDESVEACALGAMLIDGQAAELAIEQLTAKDFYIPAHRTIFKMLSEIYGKTQSLDEILVVSELKQRGILEEIGGSDKIANLIIATPSASGIESYCEILKKKTDEREVFNLIINLQDKGDVNEQLDIINSAVDRIYNRRLSITSEPQDLHTLAIPIAEEATTELSRDFWGLQTNIADGAIDEILGGIPKNEYWIVAARTSVGKSTFVREIATGLRKENLKAGCPLIISTEMESNGIARAALASAAGLGVITLLTRKMEPYQQERIHRVIAQKELEGVMVIFDPSLTIPKIRAITKRHQKKYGLPLLVIDLAGQVKVEGISNEYERLCDVSRNLATLKKEFSTCLIACVQCNRAVHLSEDKRPELNNLKGSGSFEEDADKVIFIHRPAYYGKPDRRTEIIVAKDRLMGRVGSVFINYIPTTGKYERASEQ